MQYSYPDLESSELIDVLTAPRNWPFAGAAVVKHVTKNYSGKIFTVSSGSDDFVSKHLVSKHSVLVSPLTVI